jgi:hypothetical protein
MAAVLVAMLGSAAAAATLCQTKAGTVVVRAACKKKETALNLAQFGALGPKGDTGDRGDKGDAGDPGANGGTVRAWAVVDNDAPPVFLHQSGFTAVSRDSTGVYCVTPAAGIDPTTSVAVVSVEWYHSSGSNLLAQITLPSSSCPTTDFEVRTFFDDGTATDDVAFTILVP